MSSTFLERIRHNHELDERHELAIVAALDNKPTGQKAKTWQQHIISHHLDEIVSTNQELQRLYEDKDNILRDELESMRGSNMFSSFYDNLKRLNEHHQRYPNIPIETFEHVEEPTIDIPFSGEEVYGKYFDLNEFFVRYANLPNVPGQDQDYIQYLNKFNSFFHIAESTKLSKAYISYVTDLWAYLSNFFARIQPLVDMDELLAPALQEFEEKWKNGTVEGWSHRPVATEPQPLRLGMFNDVTELEALGLDRLKEGLDAMGLKSGGTLKERAARLWQVRGKKPSDIPEKLKKKETGKSGEDDKRKSIAATEHKIAYLTSMLSDVVTATRRHAEKQQTLTLQEKHAEIREEEMGTLPDLEEEDDDLIDEDGPLYNPLNLPLGWDGKPIPFWLYKLHGLGTEFKCEICGNHSYWGRRMFDKHFQEWRHAYGMKCLGVPNTKHFHDITLIEDALALYAKIKDQLRVEQFVGDMEEEFEDSEGNVLNRRTYEDLARQGLL